MFRLLLFVGFFAAENAVAQFTPALLQNNSYWGDGKAEFNIYDAQIARYGIPRPTEVLHILVREPFPSALAQDDLEAAGFKAELAEVTMKPQTEVAFTGDDALKMQKLLDALENLDDVQEVYTNAVIDEA